MPFFVIADNTKAQERLQLDT